MFGFDTAYSLKCLASDKQDLFCQNRLWLTWEWSLISLYTHFCLQIHLDPDGLPPQYPPVSIQHAMRRRLGCSGSTGWCLRGRLHSAEAPRALEMKCKALSRANSKLLLLPCSSSPGHHNPAHHPSSAPAGPSLCLHFSSGLGSVARIPNTQQERKQASSLQTFFLHSQTAS